MDSSQIAANWTAVTNKVKSYEDVDASQVTAFFSRLVPQAMSEGFLMLTADNEFIKNWISSHYVSYIERALQDLFEIPFTVIIEVCAQTQASSVDSSPSPSKTFTSTVKVEPSPKPLRVPTPEIAEDNTNCFFSNAEEEADVAAHDVYVERPARTRLDASPTANLTFENFVIGDSNRMAYSMAVSVAEEPGKTNLNPLFIYGKSGLGKTHLMRAIQNYINETCPQKNVVYTDSADFIADFTEASAAHDREKESFKNFKRKYEAADVLLIDDVQVFQGKKQTLDMVFQIFNTLTSQGKQVVLSADRAPKNIDIDERYISRFYQGGTIDIQPPEIETKLGVIKLFIREYREKEGMENFDISDEIQNYIAESSSSNIRELKGAVTLVIYQMSFFKNREMDISEVRSLLENHFSGGAARRISVADVQKEVENFYHLSHSDIVGKKRTRDIMYARQVAIYLCRQLLDLPYGDIGKKFNRDHSTIMYSVRLVEDKIKESREVREEIEALRQIIREL